MTCLKWKICPKMAKTFLVQYFYDYFNPRMTQKTYQYVVNISQMN